MKHENGIYTLLATKKVLKPLEIRHRGCPYNFVVVEKIQISTKEFTMLQGGDDEVLKDVLRRFKERGVEGNIKLRVALGGKGILASLMAKHEDWRNTGMPTIWEGSL